MKAIQPSINEHVHIMATPKETESYLCLCILFFFPSFLLACVVHWLFCPCVGPCGVVDGPPSSVSALTPSLPLVAPGWCNKTASLEQQGFAKMMMMDTHTNEPTLVGSLSKKTPHNSWQKRQCYAARNKFMYFKHKITHENNQIKWKDDDHPQGIISLHLSHCYIPPPDDIQVARKEFCFIIRANNKDLYLSAESKQEQTLWVNFICKAIDDLAAGKEMRVAHSFKKVSFARATICSKCESFIWGLGKNGFLCTVCNTCVHKKCIFKVSDNCTEKDSTPAGRAMKSKSLALFSNRDPENERPESRELTPKEKKILDLRNMLKAVEEKEEKDIKEAKMKYEEQIEEIFTELASREAQEVAMIQHRYSQQLDPLLFEINKRTLVR